MGYACASLESRQEGGDDACTASFVLDPDRGESACYELLELAARGGHTGALRLLTSRCAADVNRASDGPDGGRANPVFLAVASGSEAAVRVLVEAGATPATLTGCVCWAAENSDAEVLRTLLEGGADPTVHNGDGKTALMHAQRRTRPGGIGAALVLKEYGAKV